MRYVSACLRALIDGSHRAMEPRQERLDDWHRRSQDELRNLVWSQPSVRHSYYKNSHGEIHVLSPWRIVDYWSWTREPDLADYVIG
jgi:4-hydroxyacetophenone monooxygenase